MFRARTHSSAAPLVVGLASIALLSGLASAAEPVKLAGAITGVVRNPAGTPQIGAAVTLYNRHDRVYQKLLTDDRGEFQFIGLLPDLYSLRVTLASFVPAVKNHILVQPGMRSVLNVNLNTLFSSIQFAYPPIENGSFMSDDWKWILRSAAATRPVLRFDGDSLAKVPGQDHGNIFSDTRGVLQLSAGDGPLATGIASEAAMGTAFALATSVYGNNLLQVSGNLGYGAATGVPAAAFRTQYSRGGEGSPVISVTMRQLFLPGHSSGSDPSIPMLRSVSASVDNRTEISDGVMVQYGMSVDAVSFGEQMNYFSPYARLVYSLGDNSELDFAYTSGNARPDLASGGADESGLQRDLNTLGLFPRVSLLGGQPKIQRGDEYEVTYSRKSGSRVYQLSAYHEAVSNAALSLVAPAAMFGGDLLPDLFTGNAIFNAGNYQSNGYTAAVTQNLGSDFSATLMYGTIGGLTVASNSFATGSPDELRSMIRAGRRQAATAQVTATSPWTGTHIIASYQWIDGRRWLTPGHLYSTQSFRPLPGLNIYVRQPLPACSLLPWRMEATADLSNMLAQGYVPLGTLGGQQFMLVQTPRSFRGGLSFIF